MVDSLAGRALGGSVDLPDLHPAAAASPAYRRITVDHMRLVIRSPDHDDNHDSEEGQEGSGGGGDSLLLPCGLAERSPLRVVARLRLECRVSRPVDSVITADALRDYGRVFTLLLQVASSGSHWQSIGCQLQLMAVNSCVYQWQPVAVSSCNAQWQPMAVKS